MADCGEKASKDFSKFAATDLQHKLKPVNKSIDDMLARLEEFQTMIYFAKQERINATNLTTLIMEGDKDLTHLFRRIDAVENLVKNVKGTLTYLETEIAAAEEETGCSESRTSKVANIFTPLFKKPIEKKSPVGQMKCYDTSDYFH